MRLSGVPSGESIFIDANIFLYSAFEHPVFGVACKEFLKCVENETVTGFFSDFVLNEVFHKIMIAEVASSQGIDTRKAASVIKKMHEVIAKPERVWAEMELIKKRPDILRKIPFDEAGQLMLNPFEMHKIMICLQNTFRQL